MHKQNLTVIAVSAAVVVTAVLFAAYLSITGFAVKSSNPIEKTVQIEVWADSHIELTAQNDSILAQIVLDNGTILSNPNLEASLDNESLSENNSLFNLSGTSPGIHVLKTSSQGSPTQYVNPATLESQINISQNGEVILIENQTTNTFNTTIEENASNLTAQNETNQTNVTFQVPGNCKEFSENILWSSNYSNNLQGSTNYQTWYPEYNCSSLNSSSCFIGTINLRTRFLNAGDSNENGYGYVQISNLTGLSCTIPENGLYDRYLAYDNINGNSKKLGFYCGNNKNSDSKCGIEPQDNYLFNNCYGIKSFASQYTIVDTFEINYTLCKNE